MKFINKPRRCVKRFALLPITIGDETRWLEVVYIRQWRCSDMTFFPWVNCEFIDKETYKKWKNS